MAKSACIEKISCPDCAVQPNTHLQTYLNVDEALGVEWFTSFCHGPCWESKGDVYGDKVAPKAVIKTPEQLKEECDVIVNCPIFAPIKPYRGIPPEYYRSWGCRLIYSEYNGEPYGIAFPYSDYGTLVGWKARPFRKKTFYAIGRTADADPFGLVRAERCFIDTLWVTEGEFDAVALDYCLRMAGSNEAHPVISLTAGGGSIEKNLEYIHTRFYRRVKYLVLVLDDDVVGKQAEVAALNLWEDKVRIIKKPKGDKDANDSVKAGRAINMGKLALSFKK